MEECFLLRLMCRRFKNLCLAVSPSWTLCSAATGQLHGENLLLLRGGREERLYAVCNTTQTLALLNTPLSSGANKVDSGLKKGGITRPVGLASLCCGGAIRDSILIIPRLKKSPPQNPATGKRKFAL